MEAKIRIMAEPQTNPLQCKFTVEQPMHEGAAYFASKAETKGSPLADRLLAIPNVKAALIAHEHVTVTVESAVDWREFGRSIAEAVREHLRSGRPAISEAWRGSQPPTVQIMTHVQRVFDEKINPAVGMHGGYVELIDVKDNNVFIRMGGGCQGCGMADVTLKQGIETMIRDEVPAVGEILDTTDHAAGRNPYYAPSK